MTLIVNGEPFQRQPAKLARQERMEELLIRSTMSEVLGEIARRQPQLDIRVFSHGGVCPQCGMSASRSPAKK